MVVKKVPTKKTQKQKKQTIQSELKKDDFRVTIFGSARIKKSDEVYNQVYELAKEIGKRHFDVVTGGGPGLMAAANAGHEAGEKEHKSQSIGLTIKLPWENKGNKHLEIQKEFEKFSGRLDHFMALSDVVIVMPGGIGTCLELFYTWQLIQVKHVRPMPIILVGKMWKKLMKWVKKYPIKDGLISPENMNVIHIARNNKAAMKIIANSYEIFKAHHKEFKQYKVD